MRTLDRLLEESASQYPDKIAVEDPERQTAVPYGKLNDLATDVSVRLRRLGVSPGDRVGISARKSIGTLTSIFGILKSGAAYVPVDSAAPVSRIAYIFQDCAVKALVVERSRLDELQREIGAERFSTPSALKSLEEVGDDFLLCAVGDLQKPALVAKSTPSLSYILYTSGSTGKPKGVIHTHESALSFVDWCSQTFSPDSQDCFSSHAPFHFDLSILDIYLPIKHGASLILISEELGKHPAKLASVIAEKKISVWYSTPSILRLLLQYGQLASHDYRTLRLVLFAGEVFPVKYLRDLKRAWPHPAFFNLYGPTETNVCTYYPIPERIPDERTDPYPIGYTCSNDRSRVIDANGREVAVGEEGELYVSGGSVMKGYWNLAERTSQAFSIDEDGLRWYKTGDVVRETSDGVYEFLGRRDRMVKRRGYRVELGEIESALYRHPSVAEAGVIALADQDGGVRILAFLVWSTEEQPSLVDMKRFCAENLPLYMIPDQFAFESSLPKTSTDKVDYQRLTEISR